MLAHDAPDSELPVALRAVRRGVRRFRILKLVITRLAPFPCGEDVVFGSGARVSRAAKIRIGSRVRVGANVLIESNLQVGDDVLISSNVSFIGPDHPVDGPGTIYAAPRRQRSTIRLIGDNLIGNGAILQGDIRVGYGGVVAAVLSPSNPARVGCLPLATKVSQIALWTA